MSYKNDHLLVIINKYGKSSSDGKAELFETYDKLRDLTVSGPAIGGSSMGTAANFLLNMSRLIAPSAYMPTLGNISMNIPGTSYYSSISGGNGITPLGQSSFGLSQLTKYTGLSTGGASSLNWSTGGSDSLLYGIGNNFSSLSDDFTIGGQATGAAASLVNLGSATGAIQGTGLGYTNGGSIALPIAGIISGIGGILNSVGPYIGPFGLAAGIAGNLASGYGGAVLAAYQTAASKVVNNADVILTNKIKSIETVCKQLDTQSDIIKKMLKESIEGDSKAIQNL